MIISVSKDERVNLNRQLGFPDPPKQVFALGRDKSAAVWWIDDNPEIIKWEVHRYRKDRTKPDGLWYNKGYVMYEKLERTQIVCPELSNDYEYRFTVKGFNAKGGSFESEPSNEVMVEAPLPPGW